MSANTHRGAGRESLPNLVNRRVLMSIGGPMGTPRELELEARAAPMGFYLRRYGPRPTYLVIARTGDCVHDCHTLDDVEAWLDTAETDTRHHAGR